MGQGFGPIWDLTTAQILFLSMAGMEDAQIKAGNGLVDRTKKDLETMQGMSVSDYAKMRQAHLPGNEIYETQKAIKERQKPLRALLERRVKKLVLEDMKYR